MKIMEKIIENLKSLPESAQTEVLGFVEYLKVKESREDDGYKWGQFSLDSAMRGIAEEPSLYTTQDIKENF